MTQKRGPYLVIVHILEGYAGSTEVLVNNRQTMSCLIERLDKEALNRQQTEKTALLNAGVIILNQLQLNNGN